MNTAESLRTARKTVTVPFQSTENKHTNCFKNTKVSSATVTSMVKGMNGSRTATNTMVITRTTSLKGWECICGRVELFTGESLATELGKVKGNGLHSGKLTLK